jgi:hypothetical protein
MPQAYNEQRHNDQRQKTSPTEKPVALILKLVDMRHKFSARFCIL